MTVKCNTSAYYPGQVPTPLNMSRFWVHHHTFHCQPFLWMLLGVLLYFGGFFGWSFHPWSLCMFGSRGWSFFFSVILLFVLFFFFFRSVEPQGVCWDIHGLVSLATPQQIDTNTNCTVHTSRPVLTLTICYVICLISRSSVRMGALSPTAFSDSHDPKRAWIYPIPE